MERNRNLRIYDSSSSSELSDTEEETDEESEGSNHNLNVNLSTDNIEQRVANDILDKKQNILFKLYNRERNGYFASNFRKKRKEFAYNKVPKRLSFCLKDIVPYCYLKGHVFMGLTVCGQFLLSYKVSYNEESLSNVYNFNPEYKYELFFWIYRPHHLLGKYFKVCLFDDHGVDGFKVVTMTQWIENSRTLIIHGASEEEEGNSHITIVSVPKLGCLDCKKMRDDYSDDYFRCDALCIKCNLTIHTKYSRTDSDPKFIPEINLSCPNKIIMVGNGFIHMINIELEVPNINEVVPLSSSLSHVACMSSNVTGFGTSSSSIAAATSTTASTSLTFQLNHNSEDSSSNSCTTTTATTTTGSGIINFKKISHIEHHHNKSDDCNKLYGCDSNSKNNNIINKNSIVEKIIADFAECETDCTPIDKTQLFSRIDKNYLSNSKNFDELVITCSTAAVPPPPMPGGGASASTTLVTDNIGCTKSNDSNIVNGNTSKKSGSNIRLVTHKINKIRKCIQSIRTRSTTQHSGTSVTTQQTANSSLSPSTSSKQIYEFSEDNEKCEKISTFRKRRLADKKYEFSDYNSENIIPFNINLRKRNASNRVIGAVSTAVSSPSHLPSNLSQGLFNPAPPNYEVTSHLHRASPSHGFRSPCGSPVGNRCLRSPPGYVKTTYFNSRSPTYTMRSPTAAALTLSPRPYPKKSNIEFLENQLNGFQSPKRDDYENLLKLGIHSHMEIGKSKENLTDIKDSDKPICSKKFVRRFVEEDDATSVITSEEDDCISPGYHTSLPMEVHGSCYSDMQMISHASYQKLKCPTVIITQHSLDFEAFTFHVANQLCIMHKKKYGIFYDWACEMIHVCPLSCILTLILMVHFTAHDQIPTDSKQCYNCSSNLDCVFHRKYFQSQTLFTWNVETGNWNILDYGDLTEVSDKRNSGELNNAAKKIANDITSKFNGNLNTLNHLRILDCSNDKSKLLLKDLNNSIEFYRNSKRINFNLENFETF